MIMFVARVHPGACHLLATNGHNWHVQASLPCTDLGLVNRTTQSCPGQNEGHNCKVAAIETTVFDQTSSSAGPYPLSSPRIINYSTLFFCASRFLSPLPLPLPPSTSFCASVFDALPDALVPVFYINPPSSPCYRSIVLLRVLSSRIC